MLRTARIVVPNYVFHITQRGNYRQNIFQDNVVVQCTFVNVCGKKRISEE